MSPPPDRPFLFFLITSTPVDRLCKTSGTQVENGNLPVSTSLNCRLVKGVPSLFEDGQISRLNDLSTSLFHAAEERGEGGGR